METLSCANCGTTRIATLMTSCRMLDRCLPEQNSEISGRYSSEQLERMILQKRRVYADTGRPLCYACAEANRYVCYVCELASKETSK